MVLVGSIGLRGSACGSGAWLVGLVVFTLVGVQADFVGIFGIFGILGWWWAAVQGVLSGVLNFVGKLMVLVVIVDVLVVYVDVMRGWLGWLSLLWFGGLTCGKLFWNFGVDNESQLRGSSRGVLNFMGKWMVLVGIIALRGSICGSYA